MNQVREAELSDAEAIAAIADHSLGYPCTADLVGERLRHLDKEKEKVFVITVDDVPVAFLQAEIYQLLYEEDQINILGLAVDPAYQKNGYGSMLVHAAEEWAKETGCHTVRVNSASHRTDAHSFYASLGYVHTKSQKRFAKQI